MFSIVCEGLVVVHKERIILLTSLFESEGRRVFLSFQPKFSKSCANTKITLIRVGMCKVL